MKRSKKLVVVAALAAVAVAGGIGGAVVAADDEGVAPEGKPGAVLDRVLEIYEESTGTAVDRQALTDAFKQAHDEMRAEALRSRLRVLVDQGRITQEQADDFAKWQQARPDVPFGPGPGFRGPGGCRGGGRLARPLE